MQNPLFFKCCCRWTRGVWSDDYNEHEVIEVMIIMKIRCLKWWWCIFDTSHLCLPQRAALEVDGAGPLFSNMIIVAKESRAANSKSPPPWLCIEGRGIGQGSTGPISCRRGGEDLNIAKLKFWNIKRFSENHFSIVWGLCPIVIQTPSRGYFITNK